MLMCQVAETLPEGVLTKMHAPPKPDVPLLDVHDLPKADGFLFGFPTRHDPLCMQHPGIIGAALGSPGPVRAPHLLPVMPISSRNKELHDAACCFTALNAARRRVP
jgi:hypothetical protein